MREANKPAQMKFTDFKQDATRLLSITTSRRPTAKGRQLAEDGARLVPTGRNWQDYTRKTISYE